jgi:pimeloyl-ACP methyl ester carboxylesterase
MHWRFIPLQLAPIEPLAWCAEGAPIGIAMPKPLLHFAHANSYPAGTYRQFFRTLRKQYDVRALEIHGHDPEFPVSVGWPNLVDELIAQLEAYPGPVILVGHSLGGMLSLMAARARPDLVRCVVMLDSPVVAGWRALMLRIMRNWKWASRYSPARFSENRRNLWPNVDSAHEHFSAKELFAAWSPGVLADYLEHGLTPHPDGVQLRFTREVETAIYKSLPHHLDKVVDGQYPVPVGFVGGTESVECRHAGLDATRRLVGKHFVQIPGGHLFPMESPEAAARETIRMIEALLG